MARQITNVKKVEMKSKTHTVVPYATGYKVTSGKSGKTYFVTLDPVHRCNCKWARCQPLGQPAACSHVMKAQAYVERQKGYRVKFRSSDMDVNHLHRRVAVVGNGVKYTARKV